MDAIGATSIADSLQAISLSPRHPLATWRLRMRRRRRPLRLRTAHSHRRSRINVSAGHVRATVVKANARVIGRETVKATGTGGQGAMSGRATASKAVRRVPNRVRMHDRGPSAARSSPIPIPPLPSSRP